jgi:hypothetical protein
MGWDAIAASRVQQAGSAVCAEYIGHVPLIAPPNCSCQVLEGSEKYEWLILLLPLTVHGRWKLPLLYFLAGNDAFEG